MKSEVLNAMCIKTTTFCDMTPGFLIDGHHHFEGTFYLFLQLWKQRQQIPRESWWTVLTCYAVFSTNSIQHKHSLRPLIVQLVTKLSVFYRGRKKIIRQWILLQEPTLFLCRYALLDLPKALFTPDLIITKLREFLILSCELYAPLISSWVVLL